MRAGIPFANAFIQARSRPISRAAIAVTLAMAMLALAISLATRLSFSALPNILPLVILVVLLDVAARFAPLTDNVRAVHTILYGVLYLAVTSFCGLITTYATQRFAFPLQDRFFEHADVALGIDWLALVHWIDGRPLVAAICAFAYHSMSAQIALPLVVLAFSHRLREVRVYLLAFAIALALTAIVATLLPAASPIAWIDRAAFSNLHFVGATPLNHLWLLRQPGPLVISRSLGGIVAFPSFHASIAIMAPVALRRYPRLLAGLLVFEVAMFGGTITEGAHYVSDVLAGGFVALLAYALAQRLVQAESGGAAP